MGKFQKVKQFLLNYQDYVNNKEWVGLLHEANFVGLDNNDVHLMIEMFKKANLPISEEHLNQYLYEVFNDIVIEYKQNVHRFPYKSSYGKIMVKEYFHYEGKHLCGYGWDYILDYWLPNNSSKIDKLNNIGWV